VIIGAMWRVVMRALWHRPPADVTLSG